jgi:hypothetical protein
LGVTRDPVDHGVSSLARVTCNRHQIASNNDQFVSEQWDISFEQSDVPGNKISEVDSGEI